VPEDVEKIVMRALEKEPEARFQSAREMDLALAECKDAGGWTRAQASAFWSTFDHKPRSGVATRPVSDDEAETKARPSIGRGMKVG
jgi:hypothetical protein